MPKPTPEQIASVARKLVDGNCVIASGFDEYRQLMIPPLAPPIQVSESRLGFYAGADYVFSVLSSMMEDGREPTEDDRRCMRAIDEEFLAFDEEFQQACKDRHEHAALPFR